MRGNGTGGGFRADPAGMRGAADGFRSSGESVGQAKGSLAGATVPKAAFGISGPGPQLADDIAEMVAQRVAGLEQRLQGLGRLADNVHAAADSYDRTEDESVSDAQRAGLQPGDDRA